MTPEQRIDEAAGAALGRLRDAAAGLAAAGLPPPAVRDWWGRVVVGLLNAGGVPMSGETAVDAAAGVPAAVAELAARLGGRPTPHRSHYSVYPHPKPSVGPSAAVLYEDAATREPVVLLVRRKKDPWQWIYPAGYLELLPEGGWLAGDRVGPADRHVLEEQTEGNFVGEQAGPPSRPAVPHPVTPVPPPAALRGALDAEFRRLLAAGGWRHAHARMGDAGHIRAALAAAGLAVPPGADVTLREGLLREVREETGLDLSGLPADAVALVRVDVSLVYSAAGQRNYTGNPHFLVDLGGRAAPPPLAAQAGEIVEAAWVPVRDVVPAGGGYAVRGAAGGGPDAAPRPLNPYVVGAVQEAMSLWACRQIARATAGEYESPAGLRAALRRGRGRGGLATAAPAVRAAAGRVARGGDLVTPDLLGPDGVAVLRDYALVAALLADPDAG